MSSIASFLQWQNNALMLSRSSKKTISEYSLGDSFNAFK